MKFSPNVGRRVLEAAVICQLVWYAKKNVFQGVSVPMVKFWTT